MVFKNRLRLGPKDTGRFLRRSASRIFGILRFNKREEDLRVCSDVEDVYVKIEENVIPTIANIEESECELLSISGRQANILHASEYQRKPIKRSGSFEISESKSDSAKFAENVQESTFRNKSETKCRSSDNNGSKVILPVMEYNQSSCYDTTFPKSNNEATIMVETVFESIEIEKINLQKSVWFSIYNDAQNSITFDAWMENVSRILKTTLPSEERTDLTHVQYHVFEDEQKCYDVPPGFEELATSNHFKNGTVVEGATSNETGLAGSVEQCMSESCIMTSSSGNSLEQSTEPSWAPSESIVLNEKSDTLERVMQGLEMAKARFEYMFSDELLDMIDGAEYVVSEYDLSVDSSDHEFRDDLLPDVMTEEDTAAPGRTTDAFVEDARLAKLDAKLERMYGYRYSFGSEEIPEWFIA